MKTDRLIAALASDRRLSPPITTTVLLALGCGAALSLAVLLLALGVRQDIGPALATWRFDAKLAVVAAAVVSGVAACIRMAGPDVQQGASLANRAAEWLLPVVVVAAVAAEIAATPSGLIGSRLVGTNALVCLVVVPLLSLAPLVLVLLALRSAAPRSAMGSGAQAGRLAAAVGAALYAFHCFDDSPLFVAFWYGLGTLPVVAAGALAGRVMLRW